MKIRVRYLMTESEIASFRRCIGRGYFHSAAAIIFNVCNRAFPELNYVQLYNACWHAVLKNNQR